MKKQPNILFLMADQLRLDHVSYHGQGRMPTPNIDRLAGSVGFSACQTVNPICSPARCSLLTGKYSHQIGMLSMSGDLSQQHPTYPRALQAAGYRTVGIGKFHFLQTWKWGTPRRQGVDLVNLEKVIAGYGFDEVWETAGKQLSRQNFCAYGQHLADRRLLEQYRDFVDSAGPNTNFIEPLVDDTPNGDVSPLPEDDHVDIVTCDKILQAIRDRPQDQPLFLFGSFCSPHKPFDPPQRYLDLFPEETDEDLIAGAQAVCVEATPLSAANLKRLRKVRRSYKALVRLVDDQIGRILACLEREGILDDTVILFTSDHGEMMGDHGRLEKSIWYKQSITVPTVIRHPEYLGARVCNAPVELTDLTATILDLAGLDPQQALSKGWPAFHDRIPCRSLLPIVRGEADTIRDFSFSECSGDWQALQDKDFKYVRWLRYDRPGAVREELYHPETDSQEKKNLLTLPGGDYQEVLDLMRQRREWVIDSTPSAQLRWAPLPAEGEHFSYPERASATDPRVAE